MAARRPAYALIGDALRGAIRAGRLVPGCVLAESAIATMFRASRSPVRQAFAALEEEGLVHRFDGRGVAVGGAPPDRRLPVTPDLISLNETRTPEDGWEPFYYELERDVILASLLGRFRVNELALARHLGVGRTVARNLLLRAQGVGLVTKEGNGQWQIIPLDAQRIEHLYDLRLILEPPLLRAAVGRIPATALAAMEARLAEAVRVMPDLDIAELDILENDLHVACLAHSPNKEMAEALRRTRCVLVVGKHIQNALPGRPGIEPFMDEHLQVLNAVRSGDHDKACYTLSEHLTSSKSKALKRLADFRLGQHDVNPPYIIS
ncbi:GntR family transcriptional regulator [Methylobacterium sp. E-066]|uniref:GntR family transcriptional regulator n=1 Tax=Methylobacterium sp. E-066 TaxID=2836584 RepID=UPI001FB9D9BA|nr:GntR family transcriptional regulator [Methylobacterium sp. E-066]MCJ2138628.1 GntR family transcriptional regulator [Methylobacterium sp. E-066]